MGKYGVDFDKKFPSDYQLIDYPKKSWSDYITPENSFLCNDQVFELLDMMLQWDPADRITAKDAMTLPYFNPVKAYYITN